MKTGLGQFQIDSSKYR